MKIEKQEGRMRYRYSREKKGEKGGHELSERNNISSEDLFTWRETLVSRSWILSPGRVSSSSTSSR